MKIGMVGCGKLGLPVILAIESKGHEVVGYDVNPSVKEYLKEKKIPFKEADLQPLLNSTKLKMLNSIEEVVNESDIVFAAIQTPHDPKYERVTKLPDDRMDFDYSYLTDCVKEVARISKERKSKTILAVISTCLPGTFSRDVKPLLNNWVEYVYTPQFIAMGTVLNDYLNPEFDLIGVHDEHAADVLEEFYNTVNDAPHIVTDITTAEGIKVSYNTWITAKTVIANLWGELSYKLGMNFDDIYKAWSISTKRLLSPKYMRSGMGDGGGCHPRDNIALSYVAEQVDLSHNIFEDLMKAREDTERWHAHIAIQYSTLHELPLIVLGKSFKPETNIKTGSPALLMTSFIRGKYPFKQVEHLKVPTQAVYFIATQNEDYNTYEYPRGSYIIDPFRYIKKQQGVDIIRIG